MRRALTTFGLLAALAMGACGESDQERAQNDVCDARADIRSQVDTLTALPVSTASIDQANKSLSAIKSSLQDIADAQGDLASDRKEQVETATKTFADEVRGIASQVVASGTMGDAESAVRSAAQKLESSYEQALAPIDC